MKIIGLMLIVVAMIIAGNIYLSNKIGRITPSPVVISVPTPTDIPLLDAKKLFQMVNEYRKANSLQELSWNEVVCQYAANRLLEIHTDWSHDGYKANPPDYSKPQPNISIYTGENLGRGYLSDQDEMNAWIQSPGHKENLDNFHYTQTCIVTDHYYGSNYAVEEFASNF